MKGCIDWGSVCSRVRLWDWRCKMELWAYFMGMSNWIKNSVFNFPWSQGHEQIFLELGCWWWRACYVLRWRTALITCSVWLFCYYKKCLQRQNTTQRPNPPRWKLQILCPTVGCYTYQYCSTFLQNFLCNHILFSHWGLPFYILHHSGKDRECNLQAETKGQTKSRSYSGKSVHFNSLLYTFSVHVHFGEVFPFLLISNVHLM